MKLALCLHNHQPVGNFDPVMEKAYSECYLPVLELLERHPGVRVGLHHSGCLLEWISSHHSDYLGRLAELVAGDRAELLTGGYYEPVLTALDGSDARDQVNAFSDYLAGLCDGRRPTGLWLTERVWEPSVPSLLDGTGVRYAVVDDSHLIAAGLEGERLFTPCLTEDRGSGLVLLGSSMELRYLVPFHPVEEVMGALRSWSDSGRELAFYGDDGEKFGVWPGTGRLCHEEGWLEDFFSALEAASGFLELELPGRCVETMRPEGPVYVPAMSYAEMGEWCLPPRRQSELSRARSGLEEAGMDRSTVGAVAPGGFWRSFLTRYPESNELHKLVRSASKAVAESGSPKAREHLWRSQCNCAYWHGVFGGLYLPHLREALWKEFYLAEREAHEALGDLPLVVVDDIDLDGREEVRLLTRHLAATVRPSQGLALSELSLPGDCPGAGGSGPVPLGMVLTRRYESYHDRLTSVEGGSPADGARARSIHSGLRPKEEAMASLLAVDPARRLCFSDFVLESEISGRSLRLADAGATPMSTETGSVRIDRGGGRPGSGTIVLRASLRGRDGTLLDKMLTIRGAEEVPRIEGVWDFTGAPGTRVGTEINLNLLTGDQPDRTIATGDSSPVAAGSVGGRSCSRIAIVDGWRGVRISIEMDTDLDVHHYPVESINRSEGGYERVHQGMAVMMSAIIPGDGNLRFSAGMSLRREVISRDDLA